MRSIPGMTVICPADDIEARAAVRAAYAMEGPVYLRFGRLAVPVFHDEANYHFELGKGEQLTEGNDIAIIATGLMVNEARMAAEQLPACNSSTPRSSISVLMLLRIASASVLASSIMASHSLRASILAISSFLDIVFTSFLDVGWWIGLWLVL